MSAELLAMLDLLQMLVFDLRTGVLMGLLLIAAVGDVRTGRIPNWLVLAGVLYAVGYNTLSPPYRHDIGVLFALGGLAVGFVTLLPAYLFRVMGAGDVKLMAMVGAFLGTWATVGAVLATLLAGGVLALGLALRHGRLAPMLRNVVMVFRGVVITFPSGGGALTVDASTSAGRMPYGVAIAVGTIGYLILDQLAFI
jgi:prepilin peptidase CpaA